MPRSTFAHAVDGIQGALRPLLKAHGFAVRGRAFNRMTEDGLTQVVNFQLGASDPPGTAHFGDIRENLHGLFTVNLGIHVPEVARHVGLSKEKSWVQEYDCCIRARLGESPSETKSTWWKAQADEVLVSLISRLLQDTGFSFLERFSTRDKILAELPNCTQVGVGSSPPRIVMSIILAARGQKEQACRLLAEQVNEVGNPGHSDYVRTLALRIGIESLECR